MADVVFHRAGDDGRFERAIRAIQRSKLSGTEFADWVQRVCDDTVDSYEAACSECETAVHEGPCVGEVMPEESGEVSLVQ